MRHVLYLIISSASLCFLFLRLFSSANVITFLLQFSSDPVGEFGAQRHVQAMTERGGIPDGTVD